MPSHCQVGEVSPCGQCGQMDWDLAGESERSQVVMPAAVLHVHFETRQCLSVDAAGRPCKGQLTADGREIGVLRKTRTLAFAHELLYQWADKLLSGSAETWSSAWLMALVRARNISEADKQRLWEQHKKQFAEATLDFIQLQGIDYDSGFACDCWQGTACQHIMDQSSRPQQILIALHLAADGITMDGIAMCFHKNQARIVSPAAAPAEPTEPLVHGASFRDRIFVPDQALRGPLLRFAHRGMPSSCSCACQQIALLDASMAYPLPGAVMSCAGLQERGWRWRSWMTSSSSLRPCCPAVASSCSFLFLRLLRRSLGSRLSMQSHTLPHYWPVWLPLHL